MTICRKPGKLSIKSTHFQSWVALARELSLETDELPKACAFSDLSLGAWKGHWVGRELCRQLGLSFPQQLQPRITPRREYASEARYVGELIDNEGRGDFNTLMSHALAADILAEMRKQSLKWIVILAPGAAESWGSENIQLIDFLAQGCQGTDGPDLMLVYSSDESPSESPPRWELQWSGPRENPSPAPVTSSLSVIPGVIPFRFKGTAALPTDTLVLKDGNLLLSPLQRGHAEKPVRELLADFLAGPGSQEFEWLAAYCYADDHHDDDEAELLLNSASSRSGEGGDDIVLKLLDRAKRKTSDIHLLGSAEAQRQQSLLRLRNFEAAAAGPLPDSGLHESFRASLLQSKAWGLVMTNRAAEAEPYFQGARELMSSRPDSKSYLYLLNISALNKLRIGAFDEALAYEKIIERKIQNEKPTDWHVTYINSINQARLYKKSGDIGVSESYYRKAFSVTDGLRSESDLLYTCFCLAQVEEKKGNDRDAFRYWVRAALHWLSNPVPESLSPRIAEAVTQGRSSAAALVEEVSSRLHGFLRESWAKSGFSTERAPDPGSELPASFPTFARVNTLERRGGLCALGNPGWGVFVAPGPGPIRFSGGEYRRLSHCVGEILRTGQSGQTDPTDPTIDGFSENSAIFTDPQFGTDLPATLDELLDSCARMGVQEVFFGNERLQLDEAKLGSIRARSHVALAPCVSAVEKRGENHVAFFKRYLSPVVLTPTESEIIRSLKPDSTVQSIAKLSALDDLERKQILRIRTSQGSS